MAISDAEKYQAFAVEIDTVFCISDLHCTMDWLYLAMNPVADPPRGAVPPTGVHDVTTEFV